ncbi:MAG: hypothetical protein A3I68_05495 [Candidatus Melainabacteria bacterium RIFCSPLOWO2_02_FULL_35_15]|nr:MAG: hypothetical protein A3F80_07805 [Candidatus Melainabacteria bacterium RIFCSPLOWO2_12_FULL_35_11]OGI12899.1 MAG: hypothetical protein A3I68_05495 [Candidatus Melainabacteria bacterium RIFCSPLOWO2_02_FULL_35_15]
MSKCKTINCPTCSFEVSETFVEQKCPRCQTLIESKFICGSCHHCGEMLSEESHLKPKSGFLNKLMSFFNPPK